LAALAVHGHTRTVASARGGPFALPGVASRSAGQGRRDALQRASRGAATARPHLHPQASLPGIPWRPRQGGRRGPVAVRPFRGQHCAGAGRPFRPFRGPGGWCVPLLGVARSSLGDAQSFLDAKSSLGGAKSSLGDAKSSLGDAKSSLGDAKSSLGGAKSSLGGAKSLLGVAKSSLGDAKSSLGGAKSSLGDAKVLRWRARPPHQRRGCSATNTRGSF
jgi:hypothetical protein